VPIRLLEADDDTKLLENANGLVARGVNRVRRTEYVGMCFPVKEVGEPAFNFADRGGEDGGHDG
jgi:hypothetical protein